MKRILCLFDYGPDCKTGYATVSRNIVLELKKRFGSNLLLDIIAVNYYGPNYEEYSGTVRVKSGKNTQSKEGVSDYFKEGDDFGRLVFLNELKTTPYDGIFFIGDLGSIAAMVQNLNEVRDMKKAAGHRNFRSIIYFPVDGKLQLKVKNEEYSAEKLKLIPKERRHYFKEYVQQLDDLKFFDVIVTYTEYAKSEIIKGAPWMIDHNIEIIYHGINTNDFFPMHAEAIKQFRKEYFGKNADKFIIGCINRNDPRKDIVTSIFGFIEAKANWDKSLPAPFLCLHMNPKEPKGWNLRNVLSMTELVEGKDYMFSKGDVEIEALNKIYNSIDVYLSTSRGEGWNLPVTECMACKIPCIIPEHTSMKEIAGANSESDGNAERALMLQEFLPVCDTCDNIIRNMCQFEEVSEKIILTAKQRYSGDDNLKQRVEMAYQWVSKLTWESICDEWEYLFQLAFKID